MENNKNEMPSYTTVVQKRRMEELMKDRITGKTDKSYYETKPLKRKTTTYHPGTFSNIKKALEARGDFDDFMVYIQMVLNLSSLLEVGMVQLKRYGIEGKFFSHNFKYKYKNAEILVHDFATFMDNQIVSTDIDCFDSTVDDVSDIIIAYLSKAHTLIDSSNMKNLLLNYKPVENVIK